jgi:TolB protein
MRRSVALLCALSATGVLAASAPRVAGGDAVGSVPLQQQDLSISLNSVSPHPKLGVPDFTVPGGDAELQQAALTTANVLWADLDFESDYYVIPRTSSQTVPVTDVITALPYDRWAELGANAVVVGTARRVEGGFQVDIRIIGVGGRSDKQQIFGAQYSGSGCGFKDPRACAHFMSDDIHKKLRALDGVARTKLVFTSDRDSERMATRRIANSGASLELYISDYDGANQQRITANQSMNLGATWSPDGRSLAYTSWVSGFPDIYISNLFEGRAPSRPAGGTADVKNQFGAWSPDGTKLAFASFQNNDWDIWVMNRDGTGMHNVTNKPGAIDNAPTWSPNGTQIAFTSDRAGSNQIYIIGVDGVGLEKLTSGPHCDRPTWSPAPFNDIAYTVGTGPNYDISLVDVATKQVIALTDGIGSNESPAFAPNGRHIVLKTTRWGKEQIAIIDRAGKIQRRITDAGKNGYPSWSRLPGGR